MKEMLTYFDSLGDYTRAARESARVRQWSRRSSHDEGPSRARWTGTKSFDEACELAISGTWNCDLPKLDKALRQDLGEAAQRLEFVSDVVGVRPNVPAFVAGEPCSMWNATYTETERRIVRVLINRIASSGVSADQLMELGATVLACISKLELEENCSTEIAVCIPNRLIHGVVHCDTVLVKRAGMPLDLSEVAFAIAHPSLLRRLAFARWEATDTRYETDTYGTVIDAPDSVLEQFDIYIPGSHVEQIWRVRESFEQFFKQETGRA